MSRHAMEALLNAECSPTEKLVLMAIARHGRGLSGSGGFPSLQRIACMANISPTTVLAVLRSMRDKGWLSWIPGDKPKHTANTYTVHLDAVPMMQPDLWRLSMSYAENRGRATQFSEVGATSISEVGLPKFSQKATPKSDYQASTSTEVNTNTPSSPRAKRGKKTTSECENIYQAYPKHKDKDAALKAIAKALTKMPYPELLARVKRYADKVQREGQDLQYVKYPATWFNAGSYEDDDLKPPVEYDVVEVSPEEWWGGSDATH